MGHLIPLEVLSTFAGSFAGLAGNLTINMGAGNDVVEITGLSMGPRPFVIDGRLDVDLGTGADTYNQFVSYVGGRARLRGGSGTGADSFAIEETFLIGNARIDAGAAGAGLDQISLDGAFALGSVELRNSGGASEIVVQDSTLADTLEIATGGSDDQIFVSGSAIGRDLRIDTGSASNDPPGDFVRLGDSTVLEDLRINGRQGQQTIEFLSFAPGLDFEVVGLSLIHISEPTRPY